MIEVVGKNPRKMKLDAEGTVGEIAIKLGVREVNFVYLLNGKPVTSDKVVRIDDTLIFMEVFSGG